MAIIEAACVYHRAIFLNNLQVKKVIISKGFIMDNYPITISIDKKVYHFEVGEYAHHDETKCKYRVFENGVYVASFEPDDHQFLHICQNPGGIQEDVLHLLAGQIEAHHPQGISNHINKQKL